MKELHVERFSLKDTLECGQTFCWVPEGNGYINADVGQVIYVEQEGDVLRWESSTGQADIETLLGLDGPLEDIHTEIAKDPYIKEAISYAPGLRIVRDPVYPCLVSFLCATWKGIPAIKTMVRRIRESCGPTYELNGTAYKGMPSPEQLCEFDVPFLKGLGLAWRAEFLRKSTDMILDGLVDLYSLHCLPYEEAHKQLKSLHGVGDKVADCIALFSLGHLDAFPIDVWIERVIQKQYDLFESTGKSYKKKSEAARKYFGRYAGYAQEYLYHYSRMNTI